MDNSLMGRLKQSMENQSQLKKDNEALKQENRQLEQALLEATTLIAIQEEKNVQTEQAILELTTIMGGMM